MFTSAFRLFPVSVSYGKAVDLGSNVPRPVAIVDVDHRDAVGAGIDHRKKRRNSLQQP